MESHLEATMSRIREIQARLGIVQPTPPPPTAAPTTPASATDPAHQPFNVMLSQNVSLRPIAGAAGPFAPNIEALATKYATLNGLSPDLVRAVIQQESGGDPHSRSATGAMGLMQLMPETAQGFGVTNAYDPEQNISAGTRYLAGLLREFDGDQAKALAAYNAGPNAVKKYGGVPPYAETQNYVRRIQAMLAHP